MGAVGTHRGPADEGVTARPLGRLDDTPLLGAGARRAATPPSRRRRRPSDGCSSSSRGRGAATRWPSPGSTPRSRRCWRGAPGPRTCGCCWSAGRASGWPTPVAGGPTPTAGPAARGCGGRCARPTPTCSRPPGTAPSASRPPGRSTWSAPTAATTRAAPCAAGPSPGRCPRPGRPTSGSAATWAVTGSRPTPSCCRTASTTGRCPATAPSWSPRTAGARWRCPGSAVAPACRRRRRPPSTRPGRQLGLLGVDDLPVVGVRQLTRPGAEIERWVVTLAGPDGEVVAAVESRPSEQAAHLTCHAAHPAHSRTWHVTLESAGG